MAASAVVEIANGTAPATPAAGFLDAYVDSADKRRKSIDEVATTRVYVDRYATGAGGTVTQATSKSTGVTLNKICGQITMNNAALLASTDVNFTLTNSTIAATDLLVLNHVSGGTAGSYSLNAQAAAGSASINVRNVSLGSLSDAVVIGFAVIKAVTA